MRQIVVLILATMTTAHGWLNADELNLPVVYASNFAKEGMKGWLPTDPKAWRVSQSGDKTVLEVFQKSNYKPKVRSPEGLAILESPVVEDFVLDVKFQSTTRNYNHRDLCLVFGYQDAEHFYYVHFGRKSDPHSNSIFIVDGKPRLSIAEERTDGTNWTDDWHKARIKRDTKSGRIEVYFDDMTKPSMVAEDKTFTKGKIGLGSFDDTGLFEEVKLSGIIAKP
jgi:hypothetical protein